MHIFESISSVAKLTVLLTSLITLPALGAELLMIEQHDCPYCDRFNAEIAQAYPKTKEGNLAPLVRLQLHEPLPNKYEAIKPATVSPTFILVSDGVEVDRLLGYPGDEHFWFLLNEMLEKLQ